jgi:cation:H+ antiporter
MTAPFLMFVGLAAVIVVAAMFLSRCADGLADQTGLGRTITGLVLLAGATSLPEFSIGFSAVRMGAVDLTAGDVLGSSLVNLLILAILDLFTRQRGPMLSSQSAAHAMSGVVALLMTALVVMGIVLKSDRTFWNLGAVSWGLLLTYAWCTRLLYLDQRVSQKAAKAEAGHEAGPRWPLAVNVGGFAACGLVIFFVAPRLAHVADELASLTGLGRSFFGTVFIATMTSLPEAVSTFAALRMKATDMAIGNILGSNAFNMLILALTDSASSQPVLSLVAPVHLVTAACVLVATCAVILSLLHRAERRWLIFEPDAVLVILLVVGGMYLVYLSR